MERFFNNTFILGEGAINERIRRSEMKLHEKLANAPLIYREQKEQLADIYRSYIDIAEKADLPIIIYTPTWKANKERVSESEVPHTINIDACNFMQQIRNEYPEHKNKIKISGLLGCKNDCYLPQEALSAKEAEEFHSWQTSELAKGGVDLLTSETIPALSEAIGIAKAASKTGVSYIISFVINRNGKLLDSTNLIDAIRTIDELDCPSPLGYAINCAHPSFLKPKLQNKGVFQRLIAYNANASSLDHCDLENADCLEVDNISEWGDLMLRLNKKYGVKLLGGCCGTGTDHIQYLVDHY